MEQEENIDEGIIKNSYEAIIKELQTIISITYVITVGIGMLFAFQRYNQFGINIFEYADAFDFLITPFSDFKVIIFSVFSILFGFSIVKFDIYWKKKHPISYSKINMGMDKKKWFDPVRYIVYIFLVLGYLFISSNLYGKIVKRQIEAKKTIEIQFNNGEITKGVLIGKTSEILFLKRNEKISAIPFKGLVQEFEIK